MIVVVRENRGYAAPLEQELVTAPRGLVVGTFKMPMADDLAWRRLETRLEAAAGQPPVP